MLDSEIVGDHVESRLRRFAFQIRRRTELDRLQPFVALRSRYAGRQIEARHRGRIFRALHKQGSIVTGRRKDAAHHAARSQVAHQRASIDPGDHRHAARGQELAGGFIRSPVAGKGRKFAHDEALDVRLRRFIIGLVRAVIADFGIRQNDDLPAVRRIGENFLVSGNRGIENDLACPFDRRTKTLSLEDRAVFQGENCSIQAGEASRGGSNFYFTTLRKQLSAAIRLRLAQARPALLAHRLLLTGLCLPYNSIKKASAIW